MYQPNYKAYYEALITLVRPGGLIAIDNVLWGGKVINPEVNDPATNAIRELNEHISRDSRVEVCMLPIGDGVSFIRKL